MGQYYKTVIEDRCGKFATLYTHDYDNGLKLMEHSYVGNEYVNAVITAIKSRGVCRVAHMGDYSDDYDRVRNKRMRDTFYRKAWGKNREIYLIRPEPQMSGDDVYIVNHDKKEYVRFMWDNPKANSWINAIMLLIAVGNGMGGGDYCGKNMGLVGRWAFDRIEVCDTEPEDCLKIHGWEFKEDY